MIFDAIENKGIYFEKGTPVHEALCFAAAFDLSLPDGRYEFDGDELFVAVSSYETKAAEDLKFEGHREYIDVQLLLEGREFMDVSREKESVLDTPCSQEEDCALFKVPGNYSSVLLEPGIFAVVFPGDLHRPRRMVHGPEKVRKMVVKVHLARSV
jgi:YhcH/YjgK/YiaL family protein